MDGSTHTPSATVAAEVAAAAAEEDAAEGEEEEEGSSSASSPRPASSSFRWVKRGDGTPRLAQSVPCQPKLHSQWPWRQLPWSAQPAAQADPTPMERSHCRPRIRLPALCLQSHHSTPRCATHAPLPEQRLGERSGPPVAPPQVEWHAVSSANWTGSGASRSGGGGGGDGTSGVGVGGGDGGVRASALAAAAGRAVQVPHDLAQCRLIQSSFVVH